MWLRPKNLLFGCIGVMFVYVLTHSERFLIDPADREWMHIQSFKWWLLPHAIAGACALILGPMQFSDRLRQRFIRVHRAVGRTYVAGVFIAAPLGVYIQYLNEPLGFARSFTIETVFQAGLWMLTTGIAFWFILHGKVQQHRQWMTRSFGTGPLIFLEVRVIFSVFGVTDPHSIEIVVWACTASSLFVADLVLQIQEMLRMRPRVSKPAYVTPAFTAVIAFVLIALHGTSVQAQARGGTPQTDKVQPVNSGANPYRVIRDWAHIEGRAWGGSNGVAIDRDGKTVWATDRCSPGTMPGCLGTQANPVHHFDESGKEIKSFGGGMFVWPHGVHVDRDGNVWVTDARAPSMDDLSKFPSERNKGSVVVKFSPDGKVLMTLGKPGVRGNPPEALTDPTDVVTDPRNGDVYVAESHTDVTDPNLIGRVSVFDKNGKFLRTIGKTGTGPGEFRTPHALEFDSQGRLIVADRHNHRIQILTKDGKFVREYDDFGRTSGMAIDKNDVIYTADSESTERVHPGWLRGIRIGSLKDGKVTTFIPPHKTDAPEGAMGEGIAIDSAGNIYTAEATLRGVTKYAKN